MTLPTIRLQGSRLSRSTLTWKSKTKSDNASFARALATVVSV